jgi:hypothetical protein
MKLELNRYALDRRVYFRILLRNYLRRRWWSLALGLILLILFAVAFVYAPEAIQLVHYAAIAVLVLFPALYVLRFYRFAFSERNAAFFEERSARIDDRTLTVRFDDGTEDTIPWDKVVQIRDFGNYFLIYVSRRQFAYLPKSAFPRQEDLDSFLSFARGKGWIKGPVG